MQLDIFAHYYISFPWIRYQKPLKHELTFHMITTIALLHVKRQWRATAWTSPNQACKKTSKTFSSWQRWFLQNFGWKTGDKKEMFEGTTTGHDNLSSKHNTVKISRQANHPVSRYSVS